MKKEWIISADSMAFRNEWLERQMRRIFTPEEIDQVLTNRRSDYSDEALIEDFMRTEQPMHKIPKDYNYRRALDAVTEHFRPNRTLHPVSYPDLRYYPWTLNVSAEAPWTNANFRFVPQYRDVDFESGVPKVHINAFERLPYIGGSIPIDHYLRIKQKLGLTENSDRSYHNLYNEIFIYNRGRIHQIKDGEKPFWDDEGNPVPYYWNTLHARSHVVSKDEPDKIRAVFGATKLLLQAELMFIWPLQATYLNTPAGRLLWGREMSKGGWKLLFQEMHADGPPRTVLGIDWSQFDKRLLFELMDDVHDIWRGYFDFTRYEPTSKYPNAKTNPTRITRLWKWMCNAIKHTPILLPNGQVWEWLHNGFGSGFQQTQLMDTFANAIMIYTCLSALGVNINSKSFWARFQGDDSIIRFFEQMFLIYGNHFLDMIADSALHYFNAKLSVKKSEIQDRVTGMSVLSYKNKFGVCYRDEEDLLRHLYFPERPQDLGRLAASAVGLAMAAAGGSDRFHKLCELVWTKLVVDKGVKPKWKALKWMVRVGIYRTLDELEKSDFPSQLELQAKVFVHEPRSEKLNQQQWPTHAGPRQEFYFLKNLNSD